LYETKAKKEEPKPKFFISQKNRPSFLKSIRISKSFFEWIVYLLLSQQITKQTFEKCRANKVLYYNFQKKRFLKNES